MGSVTVHTYTQLFYRNRLAGAVDKQKRFGGSGQRVRLAVATQQHRCLMAVEWD